MHLELMVMKKVKYQNKETFINMLIILTDNISS